ncbi:MAG: hypothetical protein WD716_04545 [Fimbriimonadaceae bacterium]
MLSKKLVGLSVLGFTLGTCQDAFAGDIYLFQIDFDYTDVLTVTTNTPTHHAGMQMAVDVLLDNGYAWDVPELRHLNTQSINAMMGTGYSYIGALSTDHTYRIWFYWVPVHRDDIPDPTDVYTVTYDMYRLGKGKSQLLSLANNYTYYMDTALSLGGPATAGATLSPFNIAGPVTSTVTNEVSQPSGDAGAWDNYSDWSRWEYAGEEVIGVYFDGTQDECDRYIGYADWSDGGDVGLQDRLLPNQPIASGEKTLMSGWRAGYVFKEMDGVDNQIVDCLEPDTHSESWTISTGVISRIDSGEFVERSSCACASEACIDVRAKRVAALSNPTKPGAQEIVLLGLVVSILSVPAWVWGSRTRRT